MKMLIGVFLLGVGCASGLAQDHGHLNVGAAGAALRWDNGSDFAPESGYIKTLTFTNAAKYAGYYQGNITLTAMHSTNAFGVVDPAAPKLGALIEAEIVSVEGPEGGAFQFWDADSTSGNPTASIPSGTTNAAFRFVLSEEALGAGQPGGDAFGHIHGRRMSASKAGIYTVGFRAHDISTNGENGAPLHSASGVQLVQFQAGVVLGKVQPSSTIRPTPGGTTSVTIGAMAGYSWQLQSTTDLAEPNWQDVGAPVLGNDALVEIEDGLPVGERRFYRAVGTGVAP